MKHIKTTRTTVHTVSLTDIEVTHLTRMIAATAADEARQCLPTGDEPLRRYDTQVISQLYSELIALLSVAGDEV